MGNYELIRIGFMAGIMIGCFVVFLLFRLIKKDGSGKLKFDERQQIVRGRGYKYGFWGWMIFDTVCIVADSGLEVRFMDLSMVLFSGMLVGLSIYGSYSIWNDGYFSLNVNPKRKMAVLVAVVLLNMVCAAYHIQNGLLENGVLTFFNASNLFIAVTALVLLSVLFMKWNSDRKNQEKELSL